jgi:hypothetical protein
MPVQVARVLEMPVRDEIKGDVRGDVRSGVQFEGREAARPAAVDAVRWGAALLSQLGVDPRARNPKRTAA